jgi:hypothetical protein
MIYASAKLMEHISALCPAQNPKCADLLRCDGGGGDENREAGEIDRDVECLGGEEGAYMAID